MKAVVIREAGGPDVLELQDVPEVQAEAGEVLIKIVACALNQADTLQRQGLYRLPPGYSPYPGLECSGVIEVVGAGVRRWKVGDEVCALLGGGGYAEKVAVPEGQVLPIPTGVSLRDAAGLPEVTCTVWSTVFMMCGLAAGETFLVHGGSSGIGSCAIQIAKAKGAIVFCTVGGEEKAEQCRLLGADLVINYKKEDFVSRVKEATNGKGVDVLLDVVGASYFNQNLEALAIDGRLFLLGFQGGTAGQLNLAPILGKRITVKGAGLRTRTKENKAQIVANVLLNVWPEIEAGKVKPIIHDTFPLKDASTAHQVMDSGTHIGKLLLIT